MKFNLIKCDKCGTYINIKQKRADGLPTMIQLVQEDGKIISVCCECVKDLGRCKTQEEKDRYFEDLNKKTEN